MRIPHTISLNTNSVYKPSEQTLTLLGEVNRTLKSEDTTWDQKIPPTLITICVQSLVSNFQEKQVLDDLPDEDRCLLLETLPTDLPLTLTVPLLADGIYWKRSCHDRWESMNYVRDYGNSWKRLYLERHLQEYIETLALEDFNQQEVENLVNMCAPYVRRLNIRQLQAPKASQSVEVQSDEGSTTEEPAIEHINLEPFIKHLVNLEELHIMFGVRNCGMDFEWSLFKFAIVDCRNLGLGVDAAKCLKVFRIHRSTLCDTRLSIMLQYMVKNTTLCRLDFSHCRIADQGALALGKMLTVLPVLKELVLCNNRIGEKGAGGLAYALTQQCCPLELLDLRLNVIGDDGVVAMCSALCSSKYPKELILAGCDFTETAAIRLGQMLQQNSTLLALDVCNNNLGEVGGEAFHLGLTKNSTLLRLDFRMTGIPEEYEKSINEALKNNTDKYKKIERELAEREANKDEEWEEHIARREEMLSRQHLKT